MKTIAFNRRRNSGEIDYLVLLFVVIVGVVVGNMASFFMMKQIAEYEVNQILQTTTRQTRELIKQTQLRSKKTLAEARRRQDEQQSQLRDARANSDLGRKLVQACRDWTAANSELQTETTRIEMKKKCAEYSAYVEDGVYPKR